MVGHGRHMKVVERRIVQGRTFIRIVPAKLPSGAASEWAMGEVQRALANNRLVGRRPYTTWRSREWQSFTTREELATAVNRSIERANLHSDVRDEAQDRREDRRELQNSVEHQQIWRELGMTWPKAFIAAGIMAILVFLTLLLVSR
ncbi:MAG: hypothetical protein AAB360_01590 [Patescibacteria group bacterium]